MKHRLLLILFFIFLCRISNAALYVNLYGDAGTGSCDGTLKIGTCGGGTTFSIFFNGGVGSFFNYTNICSGTYTLSVTDNLGNNLTTYLTYSPSGVTVVPQANLLTSFSHSISSTTLPPFCNGMVIIDITGGIQPYNIIWKDGSGNVLAGQNNDTLSNVCPGNYSFHVDDNGIIPCFNGTNNCCNFVSLRVSTLSCNLQLSPVSCYNLCDGTVEMNITSGTQPLNSYSLTSPTQSGDTIITNACAGIYIGQVTDATNATATCTDTLVNPPQILNNISQSNLHCFGYCDGSFSVNPSGGVPGYSVATIPALSPPYNNLCADTFQVTTTDATGCVATDQVIITSPLPITMSVLYNPNDSICCGNIIQMTGIANGGTPPYSYSWVGSFGSVPINPFSFMPPCNVMTYTLYVSDANNCLEYQLNTIYVGQCLSLNDFQNEINEQVTVFPNPFSETITFSTPVDGKYNIKIYNLTGKLIDEKKFTGKQFQYANENLTSGIYFYEVNSGQQKFARGKFIKE